MKMTEPSRIGPYAVVRRLGGGGMGEVFLARSPDGLDVAVKVVRRELADDPRFRTRFRREVEAARAVAGRGTAAIIDADVAAPQPWLATEYVPGPSLLERVDRGGPLPAAELERLAVDLAGALRVIHEAGLVHRDLKPANILLAADGPRVIDFGISRTVDATAMTTAGMVIGSPGFMSPEQISGASVGPASDVFSLGACLVFAATGAGPFGDGPAPALLYRIVHDPPALPDVSPVLRGLIEACLAKDPRDRPSAAGLRHRLAPPRPKPPRAAPPTRILTDAAGQRPERDGHGRRLPTGDQRRHRNRPVATAAAIGLVIAGVIAFAVIWPRARPPRAALFRPRTRPSATATSTPAAPRVLGPKVTVRALAVAPSLVIVRNATGRLVFDGVLRAGESRTWTAVRRIRLVIGNGGGVRLTVNGRRQKAPGADGQAVHLSYGPND